MGSSWHYVSTGSDNGLAPCAGRPFRRQAIIWITNADPFHKHIYAALGGRWVKINNLCNFSSLLQFLYMAQVVKYVFHISALFVDWPITTCSIGWPTYNGRMPTGVVESVHVVMHCGLAPKVGIPAISRAIGVIPPNTWRNNNVVLTSKRRHFDVITSKWRRFGVITTSLLCNVSAGISQRECTRTRTKPLTVVGTNLTVFMVVHGDRGRVYLARTSTYCNVIHQARLNRANTYKSSVGYGNYYVNEGFLGTF